MRTRTQRAWLDALEPLGVPCGPINRLDQVFADPQVAARGLRLRPAASARRAPCRRSARRSGSRRRRSHYERAPPLLGEHTAAVLRERLALDDDAIAALAARGVIEVRA